MLARVEREGNEQRRRRRDSPVFKEFLRGVGRRITSLRAKVGHTQQEAATKAGLDLRLWQRLEAGDANSTLLVFHDVARALGVEVRQVLTPMKATGSPAPRRPGRPKAKKKATKKKAAKKVTK